MKKFILPLILMLVGVGGGVGAGLFLTPDQEEEMDIAANPCGDGEAAGDMMAATPASAEPVPLSPRAYVKVDNQFVVPVVTNELVSSLIVISLSIEVAVGGEDDVFAHEPRLRDAFLQAMFDHANMGGFNGAFTSSTNMRILREALQDAANKIMLGHISDVLITDIIRQDVTK